MCYWIWWKKKNYCQSTFKPATLCANFPNLCVYACCTDSFHFCFYCSFWIVYLNLLHINSMPAAWLAGLFVQNLIFCHYLPAALFTGLLLYSPAALLTGFCFICLLHYWQYLYHFWLLHYLQGFQTFACCIIDRSFFYLPAALLTGPLIFLPAALFTGLSKFCLLHYWQDLITWISFVISIFFLFCLLHY